MNRKGFGPPQKIVSLVSLAFLLSALSPTLPNSAPVEEVRLVTDAQYFPLAKKMIREAQTSLEVMMFEMGYYSRHFRTPSNVLIRELIEAKKRGVKVEVILDVREGEDRTTKRNRQSGKILKEGGVEVIYDSLSRTTHAKWIVADGSLILLGSTNWTYNALTNNHEVSVLIRSKELAQELIDYFNKVKATRPKFQKKE
jgi:phosphatidylserine/phosphatidylglycerophosphate/cardiolipin synthase-like enzyme